jgi:hypothetical protein
MPRTSVPVFPGRAVAQVFTSANFEVESSDAGLSRRVAEAAEQARRNIQSRWFGQIEPAWPRRVKIRVPDKHPGYFATEFSGDGVVTITLWAGDAHLESTIRHEVCHAVMHLRYPTRIIPRWFDEGLAVCNESPEEQRRLLAPLFEGRERFTLRRLALLENYPPQVLLFYAQSYSIVDFLVRRHGERLVIRYLEQSFVLGQEAALSQVLGYASFEALEHEWLAGIRKT